MADLAIAKVLGNGGLHRGTAFAVSRMLAITAFHCIGDRTTNTVVHRTPMLLWRDGSQSSQAEVVTGDGQLDYALLEIRPSIPEDYHLKPLNVPVTTDQLLEFKSMGYPSVLNGKVEFPTIEGKVRSYDTRIFDGIPAIQLYCQDAASGFSLRGFSGAPVVVGWDHALGVIRWNPESPGDENLALGGMVFATSVPKILEARPLFFRDVQRFRHEPKGGNYLGDWNWFPA